MKAKLAALVALALAAGCSTQAPKPAPTVTVTRPPTTTSAVATPKPSATARLTRHQAAAAYVRIVDPVNRDGDAASQDQTDNAPFSRFLADERAWVRDSVRAERQLLAVRWPRNVEPYIRALVSTDWAADQTCTRRLLRAHNYSQVSNISYEAVCQADQGNNASQIRTLLGLPPLG